MGTEEAVNIAIKTCYEQGIMADFVKKYETEVKTMCMLEYDFEEELEAVGEEKWEEGVARGRAEVEVRGVARRNVELVLKMYEKNYSVEQIADILDKEVEEVQAILDGAMAMA